MSVLRSLLLLLTCCLLLLCSGPVGQSLLPATSAPAADNGDSPPELRHLVSAFVQAIMSQQVRATT
jgi:hypothetical protein